MYVIQTPNKLCMAGQILYHSFAPQSQFLRNLSLFSTGSR